MTTTACLADHGKHRWKYRDDSMLGRVRECQKCGTTQQRLPNGRWHTIGSSRWVPLTPAERGEG
jgi:hypothetical protein